MLSVGDEIKRKTAKKEKKKERRGREDRWVSRSKGKEMADKTKVSGGAFTKKMRGGGSSS